MANRVMIQSDPNGACAGMDRHISYDDVTGLVVLEDKVRHDRDKKIGVAMSPTISKSGAWDFHVSGSDEIYVFADKKDMMNFISGWVSKELSDNG